MKPAGNIPVSELSERGYDSAVISEIEQSESIIEKLKAAIRKAFGDTPYPGAEYSDISATEYDDEGVYEYFVGSDQFEHPVKELRYNSVALSFFTDEAFRYWLPAFMFAELDDPEGADIIAESIAYHLSAAKGAHRLILNFSDAERSATKDFLAECIRRYPDEISSECFRKARTKIHKAEQNGESDG